MYCSAISDQSLSEVPVILSYISRTYSCLSLTFSPADTCNHLIIEVITVLVRKVENTVRAFDHQDLIHIVLIPIPRFVRGVLFQGSVQHVTFTMICKAVIHIHPGGRAPTSGKAFLKGLKPFKLCGRPFPGLGFFLWRKLIYTVKKLSHLALLVSAHVYRLE